MKKTKGNKETFMIKTRFLKSIIVTGTLIISLIFPVSGFSATVNIDSITAAAGTSEVSVPVNLALSSGDNVAGLNISISFNSADLVLQNAEKGNASVSAGKELAFNSPSGGVSKLVIYSMDSGLIQDGVLANLIFDIPSDSTEGETFDISITECVLSDSSANSVVVSNNDGQITIVNSDQDSGDDSGSGGGCYISLIKWNN